MKYAYQAQMQSNHFFNERQLISTGIHKWDGMFGVRLRPEITIQIWHVTYITFKPKLSIPI